jgi:hypothetical protein
MLQDTTGACACGLSLWCRTGRSNSRDQEMLSPSVSRAGTAARSGFGGGEGRQIMRP